MVKVSVVIPTYNNARFLQDCLNSILTQTYRDFEIIVVDDGSTDNTRDVLSEFNKHIRYFYQENKGLAVARNVGMDLARGIYITYLDSDDMFLPENLFLKTRILDNYPEIGGVFSDFCIFNEYGVSKNKATEDFFPVFKRKKVGLENIFQHIEYLSHNLEHNIRIMHGNVFKMIFWGNFILPSSMLVRKQILKSVGYFEKDLRTQQDYEYWLRFTKDHNLCFLDDVLVKYRRHTNQLTDHSNIERIFKAVLFIIEKHEIYFKQAISTKEIAQRKAEIYYNLSKVYFGKNDSNNQSKFAKLSISTFPYYYKAYVILIISMLPMKKLVLKIFLLFKEQLKKTI